ncbi:electron transfer flavoprotein alpha subunit apoprotein [Desulfotomaculum arcticum]|uniref:Electron transfer flavoprotein alpha subunit apoprotein n=1 Tax=Desulfotruncus arcticus DSM 17038 TaxID=1121424 RepID=A0A1I2S1P0_9FIRM|nr:electron transfer flavoprotein subunit alpha/FixB family protein [Desulfotruncus arcticus]SFG46742.1 electron transfer flavoprotein alpha subunit apoprotein [Desulfotomaculum arcticum] [Desulfotruncus arcticus DSM 17038]
MAKGIWVFAEQREGQVKKVSFELLSEGRKVADQLGEELCAVLVGKNVSGLTEAISAYGPDKIYVVDNDALENYTTDGYTNAVSDLVKKYEPSALLLGCTVTGRDLSAQVAQRLETGLMTDCTGMEVADGQLVFTRPIYAGKTIVKAACPEARPTMATIRPNTFAAVENAKQAEVISVESGAGDIRQVIKDIIRQVSERPELTEADIIVSGGRGMKGPENFKLLEDLADVVGAAVGASRAAVDAGWVSHSFQVGQTGKTVSPVLYIACGISGAIQHLAGMSSAKCIVAINKDEEANIFKVADYGIVGDLFEVVPILTEELKKVMA